MIEKSMWQYIVSRLPDDVVLTIFNDSKKLVCSGFRINSLRDVQKFRKQVNLSLSRNPNLKKIIEWFRDYRPSVMVDAAEVRDKSFEELTEYAYEVEVSKILVTLIYDKAYDKANTFFDFLSKERKDVFSLSHNSQQASRAPEATDLEVIEKDTSPGAVDTETSVNDKKIKKLEKKNETLKQELEKREAVYKTKITEMEESHNRTKVQLQEKMKQYADVKKERDSLKKQQGVMSQLWEQEKLKLNSLVKRLEQEIEKKQEEIDKGVGKKISILVIGEPYLKSMFKSDHLRFSFVHEDEVHTFEFPNTFNAYWVLVYELQIPNQLLLNTNDSYEEIDKNKISYFNDVQAVKQKIKQYNKLGANV